MARLCAGLGALWLVTAGGDRRAQAEPQLPSASAAPAAVGPATVAPGEGPDATPPAPMLPEAKEHYDRGLELYRARDFAGSVRALERGFAIDPRREFLFAEAQALRLAGDCARAVPLYQRFIDSGPQAVQAQAARLGIDRCAPERTPPTPLAAPRPPLGSGAAPPRTTAPITSGGPGTADGERRTWWRDPWVLSTAGLGVAALGVGIAALVASNRSTDQAYSTRTTTHAEFDRLWAEAGQRRTIATVGLAAGAGLVTVGGLRAMWLFRHQEAGTRLSLAPAGGGATLLWEGRF